jgi:hypothetical protein
MMPMIVQYTIEKPMLNGNEIIAASTFLVDSESFRPVDESSVAKVSTFATSVPGFVSSSSCKDVSVVTSLRKATLFLDNLFMTRNLRNWYEQIITAASSTGVVNTICLDVVRLV